MALTPSSTIVAGSQTGENRFDFSNFRISLSDARVQGNPAIFQNSSDEYCVQFNITNYSADPDSSTPFLSVFKRAATWVEKDSANRPALKNWDTALNAATPIASEWDVTQIGNKLYIFYFNNVASPVLALKIFTMGADTFGAEKLSTLTFDPGFSPASDYSSSFSSPNLPHLSVVYTSVTGKISVLGPHWTIQGTDTFSWARPCIAQYDPTGDTFDAAWTPMGHTSTAVLFDEGIFSACVDCRGAVNIIFVQFDFHGAGTTEFFFQSFYADSSISLPQSLGITVTGFAPESDSRLLCTGTDFVLLYATGRDGSGQRTGLSATRATVPATNILPASWGAPETVHAAVVGEFMQSWVPFLVNTELLAMYAKTSTATPTTTLTCAKWNGATWDDNASPAGTVVLALNNGPNAGLPGTRPQITYDFTAPVVVGNTLGDEIGFVATLIFSYLSYSAPVCEVPIPTLACPVDGVSGEVGVAYSKTLVRTGGTGPFTFSITAGSLPPGLTLNVSTGEISGTPNTAGTFCYTAQVTDANDLTATVDCCITIINGPTAACPTGDPQIGVLFSVAIPVSGGTEPYTFELTSGALPTGLTLNTSTGVISGTPSAYGTFSYTILITDDNGATVTISCSYVIVDPARTLRWQCASPGRPGRWFPHQYAAPVLTHYLVEPNENAPNDQELFMLAGGAILVSGGDTDAGTPITVTAEPGSIDLGDERAQKLYVDAMTEADQTGNISAQIRFNNSQQTGPTLILSPSGPREQFLENIASLSDLSLYRNISVRYSWTGGPDGPRIYAFEPSSYLQPYLSTFLVTQFINLSFPAWKHHRRMYPALISNAPVIFTIKTQDGRSFSTTIPSTGGQYRIIPLIVAHGCKQLAFAYQLDGQGTPFALFPESFTVETKSWDEATYIDLAVFKT